MTESVQTQTRLHSINTTSTSAHPAKARRRAEHRAPTTAGLHRGAQAHEGPPYTADQADCESRSVLSGRPFATTTIKRVRMVERG